MIGALSAALLAAGGCASSDDDNQTLTSDSSSNYRLQLLHFSDVDGNEQSALDSVDEFSALVEVFRNDPTYGENTLFVSSGDHIIQGPRFYAAEQGTVTAVTGSNEPGHADIAMMNAMGVQAAAVGNHELDANPGEFADAIKADGQATAVFPHLASNIDFSGESDFVVGTDGAEASELAGSVARYAVVTINGEQIGLVGASTPTLPTITTTGDLVVTPGTSASVAELAAVIQPSVDALKLAGVNKIILLAHMQQIAVEKQLATLLDGVDIIVAGGSNTRMGDSNDALFAGTYVTDDAFAESYPFQAMGADGNPTLVVNVDADYKYLGRLVVEFDSNGKIDLSRLDETVNGAYAATTSMVSSLGGTPNAEVVEIRDALQSVIDAQYGNIMGYTSVYLDGRRSQVRTEETNLGYLSNAANLWYAEQVSGETVDIALKNGGGIRSEIGSAIVPPGSTDYADAVLSPPEGGGVSEGHLKATMRFDNSLVLVTVSSTELKDLLEHGVSATTVGATPGQFPQVGGMRFSFDPSRTARTAQGNGDRIRDLQILHDNGTVENVVADGAVVDPSRTFRLVTLNFLADGGDNYPFDTLAAANRVDLDNASQIGGTDPGLQSSFSKLGGEQDALAEYLLAFHPISAPYDRAETSAEHDYHVVNLSEQTSARVVDLNSQTLQLRQVGRHESGLALDTGASEIVAFDSTTNRVFVINASASTVDVLALEADGSLTEIDTINGSAITGGISVGGFNSVDAKNGLIAVAVEAETQTDPGAVAFFDASTLNPIQVVTVGALPDAVTFTPDGTKVIVSNEGQPSEDYTIDPVGSISIVDVSNGAALATVTTLGFEDYNTGGSKTLPEGVRVFGPNASVAQDMEPEYAAVSADSSTAWVTLQENNAVAIVDLVNNTLEVKALGFKDHSLAGNELDVSDRDDAINLQNWPIYGMYMPDSISSFAVGGSTYYVTANEGDARDYAGFSEEDRIKDLTLDSIAFPTAAALQADDQLGRLTVTNTLGDTDGDGDFDELYAFGARSFSIWNSSGTLVFDSGSDLERITASRFPTYFNLSNDDNSAGDFDSRSDAKGPEPEAAVVGEVNGVTYAFIGLERIGGIVVYDVSNPTNPTLAGYFNNRDFGTELTPTTGGDAGPEGFEFVSAADSPTGKALLIVGNEISGTTTVYEVE